MSCHLKNALFGILLAVFSFSTDAIAQKEPQAFSAREAIYLELGGSSGRYAVNYGRIIYQKDKLKLNVSAGFSLFHYPSTIGAQKTTWLPAVPLEFTAFWGRSNHHLELGFGVTSLLQTGNQIDLETFEITEKTVFSAIIPLRIGYRYQKPSGGFFYRVGYTPIFIAPVGGRENWIFEPRFAGISLGKSF